MKRLFVILGLSLAFSTILAQSGIEFTDEYSLTWTKGIVVFYSGDTVHCELRFHHAVSHGILQVRESDNVISLSAKDVSGFTFYDEQKARIRKFSSMPVEDNVSKKAFLENLYEDERFSILRHRTVGVPYDYMNYSRFVSRTSRISRKYIRDNNTGELLPLSRENALRVLGNHRQEITTFISQNHIRFKKISDYIHLFQFHNSL